VKIRDQIFISENFIFSERKSRMLPPKINARMEVTWPRDSGSLSLFCSLLDEWPNTYAFTKAVAEDLVRDEGLGLPIGVFRPSIG
jgi:hypothetical protein